MTPSPTDILTAEAFELGFELAGIVRAGEPKTYGAFRNWIARKMHAGMDYLAGREIARKHPEAVLTGVRSVLVLGVSYAAVLGEGHPVAQLSGIAEYARGVDYHDWIRSRLKRLSQTHRKIFPDARCRGVVDTAPIMERQLAVDAGLGRIGKSTMLIHERFGTKIFLAAFLSTETFEPTPMPTPDPDPCGECRRCLDACPTGALVAPYVLDARRCLNYWTIEHRDGPIPDDIREKTGGRFFGCDTCQDVCPWNRSVPPAPKGSVDPASLDPATLEAVARGTPLERKFCQTKGKP